VETIEKDIVIEAPADVVWRIITEPEQIAQWFWPVQIDLQPGGAGTFSFEKDEHGQFVIEEVDPPRKLSWRWAHAEGETPRAGNSVLVEFSLSSEGSDRTRLSVTETGLDLMNWSDDDKARYVNDHRHGWSEHFGRLADLVVDHSR
jgi:uncharacterized protein YndB with AHSA1/START domain